MSSLRCVGMQRGWWAVHGDANSCVCCASQTAWTRTNIRAFGGNPDAVHVAGHSAGSLRLCIHHFWDTVSPHFVCVSCVRACAGGHLVATALLRACQARGTLDSATRHMRAVKVSWEVSTAAASLPHGVACVCMCARARRAASHCPPCSTWTITICTKRHAPSAPSKVSSRHRCLVADVGASQCGAAAAGVAHVSPMAPSMACQGAGSFARQSPTKIVSMWPHTSTDGPPTGSPASRVPPFTIVHGDADKVVPVSSSTKFHEHLVRAGLLCALAWVGG